MDSQSSNCCLKDFLDYKKGASDLVSFHNTALFLYSLKTSEKHRFSDGFLGGKRSQWHEMG